MEDKGRGREAGGRRADREGIKEVRRRGRGAERERERVIEKKCREKFVADGEKEGSGDEDWSPRLTKRLT